jgi:hypothetical protein
MKNLIFLGGILQALFVRAVIAFPVFQPFGIAFLVGQVLLLLLLGAFSRDWSSAEKFDFACVIFVFVLALVAGV